MFISFPVIMAGFFPNAQHYPANNSKCINNNIPENSINLYETKKWLLV